MNLESKPIESGYTNLDKLIGGFFPSEVTIIGSASSGGKTTFILTLIKNLCINKTAKPLFFSIESTELLVKQKLAAMCSGIPLMDIRKGTSKNDKKLIETEELLSEFNLIVDDTPLISIDSLVSKSINYVKDYGCNIIFIDYIGLISSFKEDAPVYEQLYTITKLLKALAKQLNVPVVCSCQMVSNYENSEPTLRHIRGSSSIEEDSDTIILLYRDPTKAPANIQFIVAKNKNGDLGKISAELHTEGFVEQEQMQDLIEK